jgi:hypothetical protein
MCFGSAHCRARARSLRGGRLASSPRDGAPGAVVSDDPPWGCPSCPGTAVHAPDCPHRGEMLPPDPLPLPLVRVPALILEALHDKSDHHRGAVLSSTQCGCFYCLRTFPPAAIKEWVERDGGETALCPFCSVDSVLPGSEVDLTDAMLLSMQQRWFPPRGV